MRKWIELIESAYQSGDFFHATFAENLPSIFQYGLGATGVRNYEVSKKGAVYLTDNPDTADQYAFNSQFRTGDVVILKIDSSQLDGSLLHKDQNDEGEYGGTSYEYHGVIPSSAITVADH